jgi:hypothetical protein
MKRKYFFLAAILLLSFNFLQAQTLESWTWDTYKMKFKAPDNMRVEENDANSFQATNDVMTLDIYPRKGENLTYDGMKKAIISWANQTGLRYMDYNSDGDKQPIYLDNVNGYWGCAIDGKKNGFPASMLLLVDPDFPEISFYIWISYDDDYYHDAVAILKSFKPM